MPRRHSRTRGIRTAGTGHGSAIPVRDTEALTWLPLPAPDPGNRLVGFEQRVDKQGDTTAAVVQLMDGLASDLGLSIRESHSTRTYRFGKHGPAVWIEPTQGRLVIDFRTLSLKFPAADVPSMHSTVSRLFYMSNASDQPGIRISKRVIELWDSFRDEVLVPFFLSSKPH